MRSQKSVVLLLTVGLLTLILIAGCSSDDGASEEPTGTAAATTTEAATTTAAPTTTTTTQAPTTTTAPYEGPQVDEALIPSFATQVRDEWEDTERLVGGTAPDLSDDEIAAIGTSVCAYFATHALPIHNGPSSAKRMEIYTDVSVIIAEALGLAYDPTLQDAGFESGIDARNVHAFTHTLQPADAGGLCPVPSSDSESMPCAKVMGCYLFASPWSVAASGQ